MAAKRPSVVLGDDAVIQEPASAEALRDAAESIRTFSQSKSSRALAGELSFQKRQEKFVAKMKPVLDRLAEMKVPDNGLQNLILLVMQSAEDYLWHSDAEKCRIAKEEACVTLLKRFTKDDAALCKQMMALCARLVKPSTWWRRNKRAIAHFFSLAAQWVARGC